MSTQVMGLVMTNSHGVLMVIACLNGIEEVVSLVDANGRRVM
jgi:hypothetical protein